MTHPVPTQGTLLQASRTFSAHDVRDFAALSGDVGTHHTGDKPMVHGLLTASVATAAGAQINYRARTMTLEFIRPVFAGETVTAHVIVSKVRHERAKIRVWLDVFCVNQDGAEVLIGKSHGVILLASVHAD